MAIVFIFVATVAALPMHSTLQQNFPVVFIPTGKPCLQKHLHCNTSYLTAVANDYSYDVVYSRMIDGIGQEGDVLVGLSTSGNSENIIKAFEVAQEKKK